MPKDHLNRIEDNQKEQPLIYKNDQETGEENSKQFIVDILKTEEEIVTSEKENGLKYIDVVKNAGANPEELTVSKTIIKEANNKLDETKNDSYKQLKNLNQENELTPEEASFKEIVGVIKKFVKENSEKLKGKTYDEMDLQNDFEKLSNQINYDAFSEFFKKNPEKASDYILSINDSSLGYVITGELIDSGCMDIRFSEKKELSDVFNIYEKFIHHIGNNDFYDNKTVERVKAQYQIASIERGLQDKNLNLYKLIKDYDDALDNPNTENYLSKCKNELKYEIEECFKNLISQNNDREAIDLYSQISFRSVIRDRGNSFFERDNSLLTNAGKSLMHAFENREMNKLIDMDKTDSIYYGKHWDELLEVHQKFLKKYPEIYFNTVMKAPLEVSKISREELDAFLENIKNLRYEDKEPLLKQEVIESLSKTDKDKQEKLIQIIKSLANSPSFEIQRFKSELIVQLTNSENPEEDLKKIESIFLKNCLPTVGKINKVFDILYGGEKLNKLINEKSSPILSKESTRGRKFQIYKDLLNIHLKSNNDSLRDYLSTFQDGKNLFTKTEKDGLESLDQEEIKKMDYLIKRLEMLYESSWLKKGETINDQKTQQDKRTEYRALAERLENIRKSLKLKNNENFVQRIEKMYLKPIKLETIDQALNLMKQSSQQAEQRGFAYAENFLKNGVAKLEEGDLLKGIDFKYLGKILNNGSVAKEFLGDAASSDATPLDTDVAMIMNSDKSFEEIIKNSVANEYGELMIVLKNRGQFVKSNSKADITRSDKNDKLELFRTGVHGESHHGIRTGFPCTEIDYFIAKKYLSPENLKQIYIEIAKKGIYIPIVNEKGELIFTPEIYQSIRPKIYDFSKLDSKTIEKNLGDKNFNAQSLLNSLKEIFAAELSHNSGTWENYSIAEHTLKVLSQYEKYFAEKKLPAGLDNRFFRMLLSLHDIGKSQAIDAGDKNYQHYYTLPILKKVFEKTGFSAKEIRLGEILIGDDPVGAYLQGGKIEDSAQYILQKSAESSITTEELLNLFLILYKVDAGSYTKNAGGQESLDYIFEFDENNKIIQFTEDTKSKIEKLKTMIK
jgi:hypothetical protein